jgi:hypothetical protein
MRFAHQVMNGMTLENVTENLTTNVSKRPSVTKTVSDASTSTISTATKSKTNSASSAPRAWTSEEANVFHLLELSQPVTIQKDVKSATSIRAHTMDSKRKKCA